MNLSNLRELAQKATPGGWKRSFYVDKTQYKHMPKVWKEAREEEERLTVRGPGIVGEPSCNPVAKTFKPEDTDFIAALNPATVLALLDLVSIQHEALQFYANEEKASRFKACHDGSIAEESGIPCHGLVVHGFTAKRAITAFNNLMGENK